MKVTFDENGYVNGWCMVGDNGGDEYDPPEDFDAFLDNCFCYKLSEGKLVRVSGYAGRRNASLS